jgi:very-short-patch-repair endonuclease
MHPQLEAALQDDAGLVLRREHPALAEAIKREHRAAALVRVLPGVYLASGLADDIAHRVRALTRYDPDAVVTGAAAARLTWWPELPVPLISAYRHTDCRPAEGFEWRRGRPEPAAAAGHFAGAALQVLDLIPLLGSLAVDEALRRRAVSLAQLQEALSLTPGRVGNQLRREVLVDSRDEPWSPAEREFHRVLRAEGLTGWKTNFRVRIQGRTYYLDVALPELSLGFEIDGFEHHDTRAAFERDRARDALLATQVWHVVRISAAQVSGCGAVVRALVEARATLLQRQIHRRHPHGHSA